MSLPYDVARCDGVGYPSEDVPGAIDWREGCETCLRRTAPHNPHGQWMMEPPKIIVFECESMIAAGVCDSQGRGD